MRLQLSKKLLQYDDLMRRIEGLLQAGRLEEALAAIDDTCLVEGEDGLCPPRVQFLHGLIRLRQNDERGMLTMLAAAERDPSLLRKAADIISDWLRGPGKAHDSAALRGELARMRLTHDELAEQRAEPTGHERLEPAGEWLRKALEKALAPWRNEIHRAWLARRICERAPHWQHHDLLLQMRLRLWHFLPGARTRLETERRTIERTIPTPEGTLRIQIYPLLAMPGHVRNMRAHAAELFTGPDAPQPEYGPIRRNWRRFAASLGAGMRWLAHTLSAGVPSVRLALRLGLLGVLAGWPAWTSWKLIQHPETITRLFGFDQRHVEILSERYWRQIRAASMFQPRKTVRAFFDLLKAGDIYPYPPVLDRKSRIAWQKMRITPDQLKGIARRWRGCGRPRIRVSYGYAMATWPLSKPLCAPLLLHREQGRWRVAWRDTSRLFSGGGDRPWRLTSLKNNPWLFGFGDWRFDATGRPHDAHDLLPVVAAVTDDAALPAARAGIAMPANAETAERTAVAGGHGAAAPDGEKPAVALRGPLANARQPRHTPTAQRLEQ